MGDLSVRVVPNGQAGRGLSGYLSGFAPIVSGLSVARVRVRRRDTTRTPPPTLGGGMSGFLRVPSEKVKASAEAAMAEADPKVTPPLTAQQGVTDGQEWGGATLTGSSVVRRVNAVTGQLYAA